MHIVCCLVFPIGRHVLLEVEPMVLRSANQSCPILPTGNDAVVRPSGTDIVTEYQ